MEFHYESRKAHLEWEIMNPKINNEDTIYFSLGDITEHSQPSPKDLALLVNFFERLQCKEKWILSGNHDYNPLKKTWSFDPLLELRGVKSFKKKERVNVGSKDFLMLPYYYDHVFSELPPMKEYYESIQDDVDYVAFHFEDETMDFGSNKTIDLSKIKGKRIGGHIHTGGKNYLPSPVPNNASEQLERRYGLLINLDTGVIEEIDYPKNLKYVTISYNEEIPTNILESYPNIALTITDVLDKEKLIEKYSNVENVYIRKMVSASNLNKVEINKKGKIRKMEEYWADYKKEKKVNLNVSKIIENRVKF